jgi:hypothetical protein
MAHPALIGAGIGAGTALLTGKDPIKAAAIGGVTSGLFGGGDSLFGSDIANFFGKGLTDAAPEAFSAGIPTEAFNESFNNISNGLDVSSGIDFTKSIDSGLTEIGSNAGYEFGMPYYNPSDMAFQNQNLITPDMFKQANMTNMANREYLQPLGTEFQPSYLDKITDAGDSVYDYAVENPDKMLTGGLQIASILETPQEQIASMAKGAGVTPGNIRGLLTPGDVKPMLSSIAPKNKKQYRIG